MAEDPMAFRSGNPIPAEYGTAEPYYTTAVKICVPASVLAAILAKVVPPYAHGPRACVIVAQIGAAYALGSNAWLARYGPRILGVCKAHPIWLGKEAHATIQAACFPEFFALQSGACLLALGGHVGAAGFDTAGAFILVATALGFLNLLALGPLSLNTMVAMYQVAPANSDEKDGPLLPWAMKKKRFLKAHGASMLVDIVALLATFGYIVSATPSPA